MSLQAKGKLWRKLERVGRAGIVSELIRVAGGAAFRATSQESKQQCQNVVIRIRIFILGSLKLSKGIK